MARQVDVANHKFTSTEKTNFEVASADESGNHKMRVETSAPEACYKDPNDKYLFSLRFWLTETNPANINHPPATTPDKEIKWRQSNWLNADSISGFECEGGTDDSNANYAQGAGCRAANEVSTENRKFKGLSKSDNAKCVLDGNGDASGWWNCAGVITEHTDGGNTGIPCYEGNICKSMTLAIRKFGSAGSGACQTACR